MAAVYSDFICTFRDISDLKPQVMQFLDSDKAGNLYIWHQNPEYLNKTFRSCFLLIHASGGLVKNKRNENLIIFRRGRWDLPKGKAEPEETPEQTALREVQEECNIEELSISRFLTTTYHIYFLDNKPVLKETCWYEMKYNGEKKPKPLEKEGINQVIWLPVKQLDKIRDNTFQIVIDVILAGEEPETVSRES